jgi:hypothetical protein
MGTGLGEATPIIVRAHSFWMVAGFLFWSPGLEYTRARLIPCAQGMSRDPGVLTSWVMPGHL